MKDRAVPSVSAIIPSIRMDSWFDEAVDSLLSQPGIRLQLIVIFDGPLEESARSWMQDPRVTILRNETRSGVGQTLINAMKHVQHEFTARLDSDDIALPDRLVKQAMYLEDHQDTVAVSAVTERIDDFGNVTGIFPFQPSQDCRHELLLQNVIVQSAVMFRSSSYHEVGGYAVLDQMEDYHLWLRLGQQGKIAILPETLCQYRVHGGQLSSGAKPYGAHVKLVLSERKKLQQRLRASALKQISYNTIWRSAQFLRYYIRVPLRNKFRELKKND